MLPAGITLARCCFDNYSAQAASRAGIASGPKRICASAKANGLPLLRPIQAFPRWLTTAAVPAACHCGPKLDEELRLLTTLVPRAFGSPTSEDCLFFLFFRKCVFVHSSNIPAFNLPMQQCARRFRTHRGLAAGADERAGRQQAIRQMPRRFLSTY